MTTDVSIIKCRGYEAGLIRRAVEESIEKIGGVESFVRKGERLLLKPNMLAAKEVSAGVTTHPEVVRAVAQIVIDAGGVPVIGDSPAMGSALKVGKKCGILKVAEELSVEFVPLVTPVHVEAQEGAVFKRLEIAKEALQVDGIINLPKLKTHAQMFLTMGVKNIFGCVPGKRKVQWHFSAGIDSTHFAGMILDLYLYLQPRLTVMDAVISMEGNGPMSGEPRQTNFIAASPEAIALDRVMIEVLGRKVEEVPIIQNAAWRGIEAASMDNIKIHGDGMENFRIDNFKVPPTMHTNFAASLPEFLEKRLRKSITSRPHIRQSQCTKCGLCIKVCPLNIISRREGGIYIDHKDCIRCFCCQEMCPWHAIDIKEGWLKRIVPGL
ncbi:Iron-sulfur cluster-binding protein [hydrothermal vent metagenome]|uniref:Iron-sulfur cluster-binding protein n=1 Tax=hydrothermal vent metagenome TaxID=652676 RepID=A0A3B0VJM2_9ZZZZ